MNRVQWHRNPDDVGPKDLSTVRDALSGVSGWAVVGGAAVTQYAPGRPTYDVDIVCLPQAYVQVLTRLRSALKERGAALRLARRWGLFSRGVRFRGGAVDVLCLDEDVAADLFPRGVPCSVYQGVPVLARPELCLLKTVAWRRKDEADLARLVRVMADEELEGARGLIGRVIGSDALTAFNTLVEQERRPAF